MQHVVVLSEHAVAEVSYSGWFDLGKFFLHFVTGVSWGGGSHPSVDVHVVDEYRTSEGVEVAVRTVLERTGAAVLFADAEVDVERAARLRELYGLYGQKEMSARAYRNKLVMKDTLRQSGLRVPTYCALEDAHSLSDFVELNGLPVIVKPVDGSGSVDTYVVRSNADVAAVALAEFHRPMMVEQYVSGEVHHVDGLFVEGELRFAAVSRYLGDCLAWKHGGFVSSIVLSQESGIARKLVTCTEQVLRALPDPECMIFHAEFFVTPTGEVVLCEVASRSGGGLILQVLNAQFGVDLRRAYASALTKESVRIWSQTGLEQFGFVLVPPKVGLLVAIPSQWPEWATVCSQRLQVGAIGHGCRKSGEFAYALLVRANTEAQLVERITAMSAYAAAETKWLF